MSTLSPTESPPARILLLSPNRESEPYPVFPIGLAHVGELVQRAGYAVRYWDALLDAEEALWGIIDEWQPDLLGISIRNVDNVSIGNPINYVRPLSGFMKAIRKRTPAPVVLGGSGYSLFPMEILTHLAADYGVAGDGGSVFLALLEALFRGGSLSQAKGLYVFKEGIHQIPGRGEDLFDIPIKPPVSWIKRYLDRGGILNIQTQRGCALKCTYCTYPSLEGHDYRFRSMDTIIEEIAHQYEAGVRYIFFVDSVLNTQKDHLRRLAEALRGAGFKGLKWGCFLRPVQMDEALLDAMIESGLSHIEFGSDSFSDAVLPHYRKSFRFKDVKHASILAASRKVHFCHFLIFGGPGESFATIEESIHKSGELPDCPIFAFIGMRVYPGTPLHLSLKDHPGLPADLLEPYFFLEEGLEKDSLLQFLNNALSQRPNWIFGDQPEGFMKMQEKFRQKGRQGPLWQYYPVMRRLEM